MRSVCTVEFTSVEDASYGTSADAIVSINNELKCEAKGSGRDGISRRSQQACSHSSVGSRSSARFGIRSHVRAGSSLAVTRLAVDVSCANGRRRHRQLSGGTTGPGAYHEAQRSNPLGPVPGLECLLRDCTGCRCAHRSEHCVGDRRSRLAGGRAGLPARGLS